MSSMLILCAFFGTFLIIAASWSIAGYFGAPWVPTPIWVVDRMLRMANLKQGETLVDLGAGDGPIVIWAALRFKANVIGVEIDPLRCLWANILILVLGQGKRAWVLYASIYDIQILEQADVVTLYLLQSTNQRLIKKLTHECRPATRLLSRTFTFLQLLVFRADHKRDLYLYKNPGVHTIRNSPAHS